MKAQLITLRRVGTPLVASAILVYYSVPLLFAAETQTKQKEFDSPKAAADALVEAADPFNVPALKEILGPGSEDIVSSDDPVQDKTRAAAFVALVREKSAIEVDPKNPNSASFVVGKGEWPLPIPIVKRKTTWVFDTKAGREAILNRRIGANELDVIEICKGYVEAQQEYAQEKHDDSKVNQYAQKVISTPGKHDGLAWKNPDGTWGGPVGEDIAKALEQGYSKQGDAFHGYYFKILKSQGPDALLGEMDFLVDGAMIGGFALVAAPAQYQITGVETFIVGPDGVVYQKDLGADTLKEFEKMERYNPDKTWKPTDDELPDEDE